VIAGRHLAMNEAARTLIAHRDDVVKSQD
jgi:hypothetical protein